MPVVRVGKSRDRPARDRIKTICGGGRETLISGIEKGAFRGLIENVGKVVSTPPPINPYIELEREKPRSLKNWCHVVYGISSMGAWPMATEY